MTLCGPCRAESDAWLDVTVQQLNPTVRIHAIGDDSTRALRDGRRARTDSWASTIRNARARIAAGCAAGVHSTREAP